MSCKRCNDLNVEFEIRTSSELNKAISVVRDNLADGTLVEVAIHKPSVEREESFSRLLGGGLWPDVMEYRFYCTACGQQFKLSAETYHGSGGSWRTS